MWFNPRRARCPVPRALGLGTTAHTNNNHVIGKSSYQLPAPPPRAPMSTSTPQNTPMKLDPRTTTIMNGGMGNGTPQNSSTASSLSSATLNNSPKNQGVNKPPIPQPTSPQVGITLSTFDRQFPKLGLGVLLLDTSD